MISRHASSMAPAIIQQQGCTLRLRLISIVIVTLLFGLGCFVGLAAAAGPTPVKGEIRSNATWTSENSPYVVTGDLIVKPGVTLTLTPGTVLQFARIEVSKPWTQRATLRVMGTLKANGTLANPVEFTLLEGEAMGDWGGIWIDGYAGGSAELNYIRVSWAQRGLYAAGVSVHLQNSVFTGNLTAVYLEGGTGHIVENNNFSRNEYGVYTDRASGAIERNVVASNSWGVYNFMENGLHVRHNDIKSNTYGIVHDGGTQSEIAMNDFSIRRANDYAILVRGGHPSRVTQNNFLFDEQLTLDPTSVFWYIFNESPDGIAAPSNWWDTTDKRIVEAYTYDKRDFALRGLLDYEPLATERVKGTMDDLRPPQVEILDLAPCSPNGDQVADSCIIPYSLSETAKTVTVSIIDAAGIVGAVGEVLWSHTYLPEGEGKPFTTDGTHTVAWNGVLASHNPAPEGLYEVRVTALDITDIGEGEAASRFRIDLTPPELVVDEPQAGTVLHVAEVTVKGNVRDASDVAVRVGANTTSLASGESGWWVFNGKTVLTAADGSLTVTATDRAGNRTVNELAVVFDPWLSLQPPAITNEKNLTLRGEILNPAVKRVELRVTWPSGGSETVFANIKQAIPYQEFTTAVPVPFERGRNLVVAYGYGLDDQGAEYVAASTAAWVEYNPFYDRTVTHTFAPGVSLMTVPNTPFNGDQATALGLAGQFDLARWQELPTGSGYVRYSTEPARLDSIQPGLGYWLKLGATYPTGTTVNVRGTLADSTTTYPIILRSGWNLIGNPFLTTIPWDSVSVEVEGSAAVPWSTAVAQGWIRPVLWGYVGGGYRTSTQLEPWQGYWVKSSRALKLLIPPPAENPVQLSRAQRAVGGAVGGAVGAFQQTAVPGMGEWRLTLVAKAGEAVDVDNVMGVALRASDGFDPLYDWEEPPAVLQGVTFRFENSGMPALAADIRAVPNTSTVGVTGQQFNNTRVWRATVQSSEVKPVQLSWPTASLLPVGTQVVLVDESNGARTDVRKSVAYTYVPSAPNEVRRFSLEVQAAPVAAITGVSVFPNPWTGVDAVHIRVGLSGQPCTVSAGVYDAMGRLVYRFSPVSEATQSVELLWNGVTSRGSQVPAGLYQVRVTVGGQSSGASVTERLVVWR